MEAFAALIVAGEAITKAGKAEPAAVRDALRSLDIPETPFGPVKFDAKGQNAHPVLLTQVQNAKYRVVWPWTLPKRSRSCQRRNGLNAEVN
jgi:branched-chain amino acid transport system substrate-binding protein